MANIGVGQELLSAPKEPLLLEPMQESTTTSEDRSDRESGLYGY